VLEEEGLVGVDNEGLVKGGGGGESIDDHAILGLAHSVTRLERELPELVELGDERRRIGVAQRDVKHNVAFEKRVGHVAIVRLHVNELVGDDAQQRTTTTAGDEALKQRAAFVQTESRDVTQRHADARAWARSSGSKTTECVHSLSRPRVRRAAGRRRSRRH
jgi:hypothetical protein